MPPSGCWARPPPTVRTGGWPASPPGLRGSSRPGGPKNSPTGSSPSLASRTPRRSCSTLTRLPGGRPAQGHPDGPRNPAPQCAVFVQQLQCRLLKPDGVVGVRAEHRRGVVRGERGQQTGQLRPQHARLEQDERAADRAGRMPALRVPGTHPQPLAGNDRPRDIVDVVPQLTLGDRDEVVEGGTARTRRVPRPVVVLDEEVPPSCEAGPASGRSPSPGS